MKALCVDLDNTLLLTDSLAELALQLIAKNPLYLILMFFWLLRGKTTLKSNIEHRTLTNPEQFVYNQDVITLIQQYKNQGHPVYLVTASLHKTATAVVNYLKLFDGVLTSNKTLNLKGKNKAKLCVEKFGQQGFIYIGDSFSDMPVWSKADKAICVSRSKKLISAVKNKFEHHQILTRQKNNLKTYLKAIRVHQYVKNALLFLPILLNEQFIDTQLWLKIIPAFIAFCLTCSVVYIINDLFDLAADRKHRTKCKRAFASGAIPISHGLMIAFVFAIMAIALQFYIKDSQFSLTLVVYFVISMLYSQKLKEVVILDVMILTVLYTLRILAGMLLLADPVSNSFLGFSIFFFMSLSFMKRYIELNKISPSEHLLARRGYNKDHEIFIKINGLATACISVLVFTIYIASIKAKTIYENSNLLYLVAFALFYWLQRIWLLAIDGKVHDDPIVFAIKDKGSYILGGFCMLVIIFAHYGAIL